MRRLALRPKGTTLLELLVVVFVLGVLLSLILPAVQRAREAGRRVACLNNIRQIGAAIHSFESAMGHVPGIDSVRPIRGTPFHSVSEAGQLASYLGEGSQIEVEIEAWRFGRNRNAIRSPPILLCPSDPEAYGEASSYRFNQGADPPVFGWTTGVFPAPPDGDLRGCRWR